MSSKSKMGTWELHLHPAVRGDLRRLEPTAARVIMSQAFTQLERDPFSGISLTGPLAGYEKMVFRYRGVSYRIAYQLYQERKLVLVLAVGPRPEFYERLLRRLG